MSMELLGVHGVMGIASGVYKHRFCDISMSLVRELKI